MQQHEQSEINQYRIKIMKVISFFLFFLSVIHVDIWYLPYSHLDGIYLPPHMLYFWLSFSVIIIIYLLFP